MNNFRSAFTFVLSVLSLFCLALCTCAQTPIIDGTGGVTGRASSSNITYGFNFFVNSTQTIRALGLFSVSSAPLEESHAVGLWDAGGRLLASTTIDNSATSVVSTSNLGRWLTKQISPITLPPGEYVLGAFYTASPADSVTDYVFYQARASMASGISYGGTRYAVRVAGLTFPTTLQPENNAGVFGPMAFLDSTDVSLFNITAFSNSSGAQPIETITWRTSVPSTSVVEFGISGYTDSSGSLQLVTNHAISLSGLQANTLYHYRVKSTDANGNTYVSGDFTFVAGGVVSGGDAIWSYTIVHQSDDTYLVRGAFTNPSQDPFSEPFFNVNLQRVQLGSVTKSGGLLGTVSHGQTVRFALTFPASTGRPGSTVPLTFSGTFADFLGDTLSLGPRSFRVQLP